MATLTTYYNFQKPDLDGSNNNWGNILNADLSLIDTEIKNRANEIKARVNRNYVINPCFMINQEYGPTTTRYLLNGRVFSDNWKFVSHTTTSGLGYIPEISLLTTTGYNNYSAFGARFTVTTKFIPGAGDTNYTYYIEADIEGYDYQSIHGNQYMMLSFQAMTNRTGSYIVSLSNNALNRSYCTLYDVSSTWSNIALTIPCDTSGTWELGNSIGLRIRFIFLTGRYASATANTWETGNFTYLSKLGIRTNFVDTTTSYFYITQVKVEPGTVAHPYEERFIQEELKLCERYFEKSYDLNTPVGTVTDTGKMLRDFGENMYDETGITPWPYVTGGAWFNVKYRTPKRDTPSVISYNPSTGASNMISGSAALTTDGALYTCTGIHSAVIMAAGSYITAAATNHIGACHYVIKSQL